MNNETLNQQISTLKTLMSQAKALDTEIKRIETDIKNHLLDHQLQYISLTSGSVSYKPVYTKTLDMKAFRASEFAFVYDKFATIEKTTYRFKVA